MEEIIIDGVNVAGCEFYDNGNCRECDMRVPFYSDIDCYDKCNKECYYKQLKRLEQENAELKKYEYYYLDKFIDLKQALEEIREIMQEICNECFEIDNFAKPDDCGICEWARVLKVINEVLNKGAEE